MSLYVAYGPNTALWEITPVKSPSRHDRER